jgi:ABC-type transporter Mla maintaining outer membrane lipid asymmetry ATPase subunit MlaF
MSELIRLRGVTVLTEGHESLSEVDLSVTEGACTLIMGPSGSGKSTLLKVAAGLIPPDRGAVMLRGDDLATLGERRMLAFRRENGFVFQDGALWENKSIFENLALPLQVHHPELGEPRIRERVLGMLERGGLADSPGLRPAQLSGGERKIVSFLRATIAEPKVVFLDEPTLSIDHTMADLITGMIRDLKAQGCTILAVAHDPRLASLIADRLAVIDAGRLVAEGPFDEVKRSSDPRVRDILARVLGEISSFGSDLLDLLDGGTP